MLNAGQKLSEFRQERMVMAQSHALIMSVQELARKNGVHHIPVVRGGRLVGVVCTCDMMLAPPDTKVEEIMKSPVTLSPESCVEEAALLMKAKAVGSVVLMCGDTPCGIVTRGDVFSEAPTVAEEVALQRCACCGIARHLRADAAGMALCIFCAGSPD